MRYRILVATLSTLAAFSAGAQPVDKRPSMEPVGSPFTYEVLGATPSLRFHKRTPRTDSPAVANVETRGERNADSKAAVGEQTGTTAAVEHRRRAAPRTAK
jgi:hypothetical protein